MKRVIILKKIQVTMKTFISPFFNHFSLSLNRKKRVVMRVREIDCLWCSEIEVDAMLIVSAKIPQCKESISSPAFMGY